MNPKIVNFCHQSGKCPFLEVTPDRIVLKDKDQQEAGAVTLTVEQAEDLIKGLQEALDQIKK